MGQNKEDKKAEKEAMNKLRESRKASIQAATSRMKTQKKAIKAIKDQLENHALTVPEIAAATGAAAAETLWYIAALKKYGLVIEAEKDGSYFKYALSGKQTAENFDEAGAEHPV
jgi:predicted transcriptional regulator